MWKIGGGYRGAGAWVRVGWVIILTYVMVSPASSFLTHLKPLSLRLFHVLLFSSSSPLLLFSSSPLLLYFFLPSSLTFSLFLSSALFSPSILSPLLLCVVFSQCRGGTLSKRQDKPPRPHPPPPTKASKSLPSERCPTTRPWKWGIRYEI